MDSLDMRFECRMWNLTKYTWDNSFTLPYPTRTPPGDEWMCGYMSGWMGGWMDGRMGDWVSLWNPI